MRAQYYVGYGGNGDRGEVFKAAETPTVETHGHLYAAVVGPYRTKRAAVWTVRHGFNNPHIQSVADAERLSRASA